ncbi:hypothetical protein DUNSADRAFT_12720 [Dunaliella salina]|uniref:C2 NT-type domain-containing protein n=1 Tax=Dunaliella salina TaxID=3046 RepID=A0ABQ7GAW2_DUNSA|nr:hypothetical protein DUNSADRAFT_12720 [Dunaliella salina]|eukprot:KAF5831698.1 hypothetical protein DUNSADRAFT_12720 [Dunaliella salina]
MFKKLGGGLKTLGKGKKEKLRVDLEVIDISGLPPPIRECRVMWITQKGMVQLTPSKVVRAGTARFRGQTMTHITSMNRNKDGECKMKAPLDLSKYVSNTPEPSTQSDVIPLQFKVGAPTPGYLKFSVTCTRLGEVAEDGMTDMTGLTSEADQDLDGFEMPPSPTGSMRSVRTSASGREPSILAKHEKKGSLKSNFMSRIQSLGKDSFNSSKLGREEPRASTDGGSGAGHSTRASDSGSGITEPSRPAPDFGKKTGSTSGQSGRPPEYKPPTPSDFSKKTGAASSSAAAGAYGGGGLGKPPRPTADLYAEQERNENDSEEEAPAPAPKPPTSSTQPHNSSSTATTTSTTTNNNNTFRPSTPPPAPPVKPEIANPFRTSAALAASPATPDHVPPPASSPAAVVPGAGKPGAAPSSQPSSSTAASDAAAAGPSSSTAASDAAAAKAFSSAAMSDAAAAAAAAAKPSVSLSPAARAAAGSTASPSASVGASAARERQTPERSSNKPAAPLAWRGSKVSSRI